MRQRVLLDTGPLVALLDRSDRYHNWATREWANIELPLLTCEAVVTEACFLLKRVYGGEATVISFIDRGTINISFSLNEEVVAVGELLNRYQSVPMSLADACLVRMAELFDESELLTLDSDFLIYRKNRNQNIAAIAPKDI
ncbi:pilus assembly protein [Oscillatoriales cyanobacterium USR001]|nr:pilus assembly protein [Oscillatoriales cyanobacterium USR001]